MISSQAQPKSLPGNQVTPAQLISSPLDEEQLIWEAWNPVHPSLDYRDYYSTVVLGDKVIILGGHNVLRTNNGESHERALDIVILDPKKQSLKVLLPTGAAANLMLWPQTSACYWKENKIVVAGGINYQNYERQASVGIITLSGLDSEYPSAHLEQVHPSAKITCLGRLGHIYQDKMYVTGLEKGGEIACLDLATWEWEKCEFTGDFVAGKRILPQYAASENKIYAVVNLDRTKNILHEFDLDKLTCRSLAGPKAPRRLEDDVLCRQVIDGKIYALTSTKFDIIPEPTTQQEIQLWAYDIDSQEWTEINVPNGSPVFNHMAHLFFYDEQFVLYGGFERHGRPEIKQCWSLQFHLQKPSKASNLTSLQQAMKKFLTEAPYSDICFEVGSETILAHKWWLIQRSRYFANMFSSGMLETQASTIRITDMTAAAFRAFLDFLYTDQVELNDDLAIELLQQADKYSIADLKVQCENYLSASLSPRNYVRVGQVAELVEAVSLRQAVVDYIGKNMKKLKGRKDFEQISDHLLRDSIVKFIVK